MAGRVATLQWDERLKRRGKDGGEDGEEGSGAGEFGEHLEWWRVIVAEVV
jgi:hypothetical protein